MYLSDHDAVRNIQRKMLCEFKKVTEKLGLRIHPDKTKILSNQSTIDSDTKSILKLMT